MKILHGTWIPQPNSDFIQKGAFYLWVETDTSQTKPSKKNIHPRQLSQSDLATFLQKELGISSSSPEQINQQISPKYFALPTANSQLLPSPELAKYLETETETEPSEFTYWEITTYEVATEVKTGTYTYAKANNVIKLLNDLHFLAQNNLAEIVIGSDLLFWYHYTQSFKEIILKDQYIPALKYREVISNKTKKKTTSKNFEIYAGWEIISRKYTELVAQYTDYMPLVCTAGSTTANKRIEFYSKDSLLKHFSECLLHDIVTHTPSTAKFNQQIKDTLVYHCFSTDSNQPRTSNQVLEEYQQWSVWKEKLTRSSSASNFDLGFQLQEANTQTDKWQIHFVITAKQDPSFKLFLSEYWQLNQKDKTALQKQLGKDLETHLLLNLGYAAKMYPKFSNK